MDLKPMEIDWELYVLMIYNFRCHLELKWKILSLQSHIQLQLMLQEMNCPTDHDECFFTLIDRNGKWRINTLLKGFATKLSALASSFSNTGDIILIGKNKHDMLRAFNRMKELGGGIVMVEDEQVVCEMPLTLNGIMSDLPVEELIIQEKKLFSEN